MTIRSATSEFRSSIENPIIWSVIIKNTNTYYLIIAPVIHNIRPLELD